MTFNLSGLFGGGNTSSTTSTTSTALPSTTYSLGAFNPYMSGMSSFGGLSYPMTGIASGLVGGINGGSSFGMTPSMGGYYGFQPMTSYSMMGGYSPMYMGGYSMPTMSMPMMPAFDYTSLLTDTSTTGSSGSSGSGSTTSSGGLLGPGLGTLVGSAAQGLHGIAEEIINATGLGGIFGPLIDDPIIHPLLWDPISLITGYDVSKHPSNVPDVSDPLGVRGGDPTSSSGGGLLSGLLGML